MVFPGERDNAARLARFDWQADDRAISGRDCEPRHDRNSQSLTDQIGESRRVAHTKRNGWIYPCFFEQAPGGGLATRRGHQERLMPEIR
jgi:hypothetical protein